MIIISWILSIIAVLWIISMVEKVVLSLNLWGILGIIIIGVLLLNAL